MSVRTCLLIAILAGLSTGPAGAGACKFPRLPAGARGPEGGKSLRWMEAVSKGGSILLADGEIEIGTAWTIGDPRKNHVGYLIARCQGTLSCPRHCRVTEQFEDEREAVLERLQAAR